jgi:hypothetical protein
MCELLLLGRDLCERKLKEGCSGSIGQHDGIHVIFPKAFRTTEQCQQRTVLRRSRSSAVSCAVLFPACWLSR